MDITERKRSEQERDGFLSQLKAVIDHIDSGLIICDAQGKVLEMNPVARELYGYSTQQEAQEHATLAPRLFDLLQPDGEPLAPEGWPRMRTVRGETFSNWELRHRRKDNGPERMVSFGGTPIQGKDDQVLFTIVTLRDVTERWKIQEELERKVQERTAELDRLNHTLQAIIDCNQAIIRAHSEQELLGEFCRISMGVQGIDMAWVGLAESDVAKSVRPAAFLGFHDRDLGLLRISWADDEFGQGPAGRAIRTGQVCLTRNQPTDPDLFGHRELDLNPGFGWTIALPLRVGNQTFGALVLYSSQPEIADESQLRMLRELANNLSIAISTLRSQEERDRALRKEEALSEQLRGLTLELAQTERRERHRLAQLLHDHLQQLLVGATFSIEVLRRKFRSVSAQKTIEQLALTLSEALEVSRVTVMELSPPIFHAKGLRAGLEWLGSQMYQKYGLNVAVEMAGHAEPEDEQIRMFLFEAVRELLLNIIKHAKVDRARVRIRPLENDEIEVTVTDNGAGFDATRFELEDSPPEGFGLFNIRERVKFLQGRMEIESFHEGGSRFTLIVPSGGWQEAADPFPEAKPLPRSGSSRPSHGGRAHADQDPDCR
jgi:PAS domain S-box-containing protein